MKLNVSVLGTALLLAPAFMVAQSPVSGFMKAKGTGSLTLSSSQEKYDEVFFVPQSVRDVPVFNEVKITSYSIYGDYGVSNDFNVVVNVPYIVSEGQATLETLENNGLSNEVSGFQDLSVYGKYRLKTIATPKGKIDLIAAAGLETPLGDYTDAPGFQSIITIGNRSTRVTGFAIAHYKNENGIFATGQIGYSVRSNEVPNALLSEFKLGYASSKFYVHGYVANQLSDKDGVDIFGQGFTGFFPATRVNYTRVGVTAYVPVVESLGVSAGYNAFVAGRNLGVADGFNLGVTYSF